MTKHYDREQFNMPEEYKPKKIPRHLPPSSVILAVLVGLVVLIGIGIAIGQLYTSGYELLK